MGKLEYLDALKRAMLGLPPALWTSPLYEEVLPAIVGDAAIYVTHAPGGGAPRMYLPVSKPLFNGVCAIRPIPNWVNVGITSASTARSIRL